MQKPLKPRDHGIIMEFKIYNPKKESSLEETVQRGKEVLIGSAPLP